MCDVNVYRGRLHTLRAAYRLLPEPVMGWLVGFWLHRLRVADVALGTHTGLQEGRLQVSYITLGDVLKRASEDD